MNLTNPYLPDNVYIPDGEPHVYGDRVYLYGSHDLPGTRFPCEGDYQCWSAPLTNLSDWCNEGTIYRRLQDPFIRRHQHDWRPFSKYLFALDVIQVGPHWYLYYGVGMSGAGIGVAVADAPTGPFKYLGRVTSPDGTILGEGRPLFTMPLGIPIFHKAGYPYDPALLYDQGRLFLYFGYGHCYVAELSTTDMRTLITSRETGRYVSPDLVPPVAPWKMVNGPSIRRIDDQYYLTYYGKRQGNNALCYATAAQPWGPFTFRGVLVFLGNGGVFGHRHGTAYQGNTHGGLFMAAGRFYQSYHRQTGDRFPNRQACLVELKRAPDGYFKTAEFTSQVQAAGGLPWDHTYGAKIACVLVDKQGRCRKGRAPFFWLKDGRQVATNLRNGSQIGVKYLDFTGAGRRQRLHIKLQNSRPSKILVRIDHGSRVVGTVETVSGHDWFTGVTTIPAGRHAVYFEFQGVKGAQLVAFRFGRGDAN